MAVDPDRLTNLSIFAALPADELRLLAQQMRPCHFDDGQAMLEEGGHCDEFYIVAAGEVEIIKGLGTPDQRLLAVRPAGSMVGELSLFSPGGRHTASVLAHGPLEAFAMTRAGFDQLLSHEPRLAYNIVQTLSLRLIESEQTTIRDLRAKNEALAEALAALQAAQARLVEKEKLDRELEVACRIQCSLLGPKPTCAGYDFGCLLEPMSAVGGDFYDFVEFPDGRVGLAIGDVSDHGVPSALFVTMTITLLRAAARTGRAHGPAAPADVLRAVNRGLMEFDTSGMFVTVLYGVLDPRQREFAYARAGHEPPLLHLGAAPHVMAPPRSAEESGMWIVDSSAWGASSSASPKSTTGGLGRRARKGQLLSDDEGPKITDEGRQTKDERSTPAPSVVRPSSVFQRGQALGVFPDPQLDEQRLPLPPHSTLLLYTDGAREAWDQAGAMFGEAGLRRVLAETDGQSAQDVCQRIFQRLAEHRGPAPQQDDVTLLTVRTA